MGRQLRLKTGVSPHGDWYKLVLNGDWVIALNSDRVVAITYLNSIKSLLVWGDSPYFRTGSPIQCLYGYFQLEMRGDVLN